MSRFAFAEVYPEHLHICAAPRHFNNNIQSKCRRFLEARAAQSKVKNPVEGSKANYKEEKRSFLAQGL